MSLAAKLPYSHPYANGFGYGGTNVPTDTDGLDYLSRMATADGAGLETGIAGAIDRFIKACKADNIWDSIRSSCILAGARSLNGALVPIKNEGPELWTEQTPTINDADGSAAEWNAATLTMSNTSPTTAIIRPRFDFNVGFENGKQYRLSGRLSGDLASIRNSVFRMGNTGTSIAFDPSSGLFDAIGTASGGILPLLFTFDGSLGPFSVTIESLSIREVIDDPVNSPVGNGFVSGDYSRTAGLKGDGTSYIDSERATNADPTSSMHLAVYPTAIGTTTLRAAGSYAPAESDEVLIMSGDVRCRTRDTVSNVTVLADAIYGVSRSSSTEWYARGGQSNFAGTTGVAASANSRNMFIFAYNNDGSPFGIANATLAFYSIGTSLGTDPAVGLADLDTAVTNLMADITFFFNTGLNPADYDTETVRYVNAGYAAGGTLE